MRQPDHLFDYSKIKALSSLLLIALSLLSLTEGRVNMDANEEKSINGRGAKQISDINMLLPITCDGCSKVSYQISAINGCYQWEVSHPNLIEIKGVPSKHQPECSNIATARSISTKPTKSLIWISAKDQHSGQVLRCEVKLGKITKLRIQTHLRQFYLNDYEHLGIAAYDEEGNIFSGLNGFRFDWNIESGNDHVKVVTYKEASHAYSELQEEFEYGKMQSDDLFLKGVKQGVSVVSSKINEPGYEDIPMSKVSLTVTEPFVVIPQTTVYLAPTSRFQFQLARVTLKNNDMSFSPISLPSKQYQWNIDDSNLGLVSEDGVFLSRDQEGLASILVVDQNIANNTAESSVKVVFPHSLDFDITDVNQQIVDDKIILTDSPIVTFSQQLNVSQWDNNLYLVEGHVYLLKVQLYDKDKNPIILTDNLIINHIVNKEYFDIIKVRRASEFIIKAKKVTPQNLKSTVSFILEQIKSQVPGLTYQVDQQRLRAEKDLTITEAIKINHPTNLVLLPVLRSSGEDSQSGEVWQLTARGGSSFYHWSIQNKDVAVISGAGQVRSVDVGTTLVTVVDSQNKRNYHTITVEVTPIASFQWLEDHIEAKKNKDEATLNIIALDKIGRKFTNCTSVDIQYELKGAGILRDMGNIRNYEKIKAFVQSNKDLLDLKQRFTDAQSANFITDIQKVPSITQETEDYFLHNNFGICGQHKYQAQGEGLARVKGLFTNMITAVQTQQLETSFAEIAVYDSLVTKRPNYNEFFNSLNQKNLVSQDDQTFSKYFTDNVFILSFGSSVHWLVKGGTNFWKDIPEKYQSEISHQIVNQGSHNDIDINLLKSVKVHEQTTLFDYTLQCQKPLSKSQMSRQHQFKVTLYQQNIVSKYLLRPAKHSISIDVYCESPKTLKLTWSQENSSLPAHEFMRLPSSRVINEEQRHYVLTNSNHHIRSMIFDEQSQVFYNHSSISTEISSSDEKMINIKQVQPTFQDSVFTNTYDIRSVKVNNQTGTAYINGFSKGYYSSFFKTGYQMSDTESLQLPYEVKDKIRLEIVRNVDIQPKYKSMYLSKDNKYTFNIMHGSGHFSVSINNTQIADKVFIDGERTITIIPKKEGPIEIRVEDIELPDSAVSVSELLISDISRLELDAPGTLIEQGSEMELNVTAFDLYGNPFDDEQYKHMIFNIEIEVTQQRERGLITEADPSNNRRFIAKGFEPANYQTSAFTHKFKDALKQDQDKGQRVTSEMLKIEVFPLLEIYPAKLLLTPQMKYTLQIVGGPSRSVYTQAYHGGAVEINFKVQDEKHASVDKFREVTGNQIGDTNLYYEIVQIRLGKGDVTRRTIVSSKVIPIRVRLATSIDIPFNDQRTFYSGGMIKLIGILKFNEETFTHGVAPISYEWNISNPNILSLNLPQKADGTMQTPHASTSLVFQNKKIRNNQDNNNNAVFMSHFNSSTIYTTGGQQGEAFITLQLAIEYPEIYKDQKNWFSKTITLRVKDKLKVDIPEFINNPEKQTHLYLMPPNTYSKIETNRKTRLRLGYSQQSVYDYSTNSYEYRDSQTPIIQLINEEGVKTMDKYGKVTVIIEENQAFSDQVVMLNVLITDIYSLASKDVYQTLSFPLGSQMKIPIKFQNEHGHQFANNIEGIEVGIELSHPRVVSAQLDQYNSTIQLQAEGSGECNLLVYLIKQPHIYDVFKIRVSSVVKPYSPVQVHVGGDIQFKIMDHSAEMALPSGDTIWSSGNPNIISINPKTGHAKGLQEGKSDILLSNHINAASIVQVSKVKWAEVDPQSRQYMVINTDEQSSDVRIRLKLYLDQQTEELTPSVQFDGITLIQNNVGLQCESDFPEVIQTRSQVNELEGFFCVVSFRPSYQRQIPKSAQITVTAYAQNPQNPQGIKNAIYSEKVLSFDVQLLSRIKVETYYRRGIVLHSDDRTASVKIYSNTPFTSYIVNTNDQDKGYELVKFKVNKTTDETSEYTLTVTVPQEITHDFQSEIFLVHPQTNAKTIIPLSFENKARSYIAKASSRNNAYEREDRGEAQRGPSMRDKKEKSDSVVLQFLMIVIFGATLASFILLNFFNIHPLDFMNDLMNLRFPFRQRQNAQPARHNMHNAIGVGGGPIRPSLINQQQQNFPQSYVNSFNYGPGGGGQSGAGAARQPYAQQLSKVDYSADSIRKFRSSIYNSGN